MLNLLDLAHSTALTLHIHAKALGNSQRTKDIEDISTAEDMCCKALGNLLATAHIELRLVRQVLDVHRTILSIEVIDAICSSLSARLLKVVICRLGVYVHHAKATLGQRLDELKLGACHILHRAKCLEVHLAHRRYDTHLGAYQVANLLDVATLLSTHLHDEYLVVGLEVLTHGAHHAKRSVEVTGCHQHVVLLR